MRHQGSIGFRPPRLVSGVLIPVLLVFGGVILSQPDMPGEAKALFLTFVGAAVVICIANIVLPRGVATGMIDVDVSTDDAPSAGAGAGAQDIESRLRRLDSLRAQGLVTESEFAAKREEILRAL